MVLRIEPMWIHITRQSSRRRRRITLFNKRRGARIWTLMTKPLHP